MAVVGKVISMAPAGAPVLDFQKYIGMAPPMPYPVPYGCAYGSMQYPAYHPYKPNMVAEDDDIEIERTVSQGWADAYRPPMHAQMHGGFPMYYSYPSYPQQQYAQHTAPTYSQPVTAASSEPSEASCSHRGRTPEPYVTSSARSRSATSSASSNENCSLPRPRSHSQPPISSAEEDFE